MINDMEYNLARLFVLLIILLPSCCLVENHPLVTSDDGRRKILTSFNELGIDVFQKRQEKLATNDNMAHINIKMNESSKMVLFETKSSKVPYLAWGWFFKKHLQVFKSIMVGEAELKDLSYDSMCFIDILHQKEIVDFESMKMIFQMSRESRTPEIDLSQQLVSLDVRFLKNDFQQFGTEIQNLCSNVQHIYTSSDTIKFIARDDKDLKDKLMSSIETHATKNESAYPLCEEAVSNWDLGCLCRRPLCIPWYPCGLKYCPGQDEKYVCGLLTCHKCKIFEFHVGRKDLCFWNINDD